MHLECRVKVFPSTSIVWIVSNSTTATSRVLRTTARVTVSGVQDFIHNEEPYSKSDLYINSIMSDDSGDYMCLIDAGGHTAVQTTVHTVTVLCKTHYQ